MNDVLKKLIQTWDRQSDIEDSIRLLLQIPPQEGSVQAALTIIAKTLGMMRKDLDDLTKKVIGELVEGKEFKPYVEPGRAEKMQAEMEANTIELLQETAEEKKDEQPT